MMMEKHFSSSICDEFIVPKLQNREEIIWLNHTDRHHSSRVTIQINEESNGALECIDNLKPKF